jgi:hypothetical protein
VYLSEGEWRLADKRGTFLKKRGRSLDFPSREAALDYARTNDIDVEE